MKFSIVTVTYGDRVNYIYEMISYVENQNSVEFLVIVTNGISLENFHKIKSFSVDTRIIVHQLKENLGSAGGFHIGIELASKISSGYILLLDDDNIPTRNNLGILKNYIINIGYRQKDDCILLYRPSKPGFTRSLKENNPYAMLGTLNSFMGFNICDIFFKNYPPNWYQKILLFM